MSQKDRQGYTIIACVVLVLVALLIASQQFKPAKRDAMGCLPGEAPSSTVILLDQSEGVSKQTSREIERRVLEFVTKKVATDGRVSLYAVSDTSSNALLPLYEGCKPPSSGNDITNSDKAIKARFDSQFMDKLGSALTRNYKDSMTSPIAQAISDLSASQDLRAAANKLIIFSDMIENSSALNMYRCMDGQGPIKTYRSNNAGAIERPSFSNVSVSVHFIPRRGLAQGTLQCRNQFWNWFFGNSRGQQAELDFDNLPG
jgi:hypothetical protein